MSHAVQFISVLFINRKTFNFSSYLICCAISQGSESVKSCINIVVHQIMVVKIFFIIAFSLSVLYLSVFEESTFFSFYSILLWLYTQQQKKHENLLLLG